MINDNQNIGLGNNEDLQNNRNIFVNDNKTSNEKQIIQDGFNSVISPHLEKIKLYKDHLKSKIALEFSVIGSNKQNYDEKQYLSNFSSGAVEYGLPCEVVYNRSLEVILIINNLF